MLKYVDTKVTFSEIPDEITLCLNLSNCPNVCKNCHSPYLSEDIGEILVYTRIIHLILCNRGITAICFMGGDNDPKLINHYASIIKDTYPKLKVGWYSGKSRLSEEIELCNFDFIKLGSYIEELGPLTSKATNQRFYKVIKTGPEEYKMVDKTYLFWKNDKKDS